MSENLYIRALRNMDAYDLNGERAACARGEIPAHRAAMTYAGRDFPDTVEYCTEVIDLALEQGLRFDLYISTVQDRGLPAEDAANMLRAVLEASRENENSYELEGSRYPLNCPLALDAAAIVGYANPDTTVRPQWDDDIINDIIEGCYEPGRDVSTRLGYIAGARLGQRLRNEDNVAELPESPPRIGSSATRSTGATRGGG